MRSATTPSEFFWTFQWCNQKLNPTIIYEDMVILKLIMAVTHLLKIILKKKIQTRSVYRYCLSTLSHVKPWFPIKVVPLFYSRYAAADDVTKTLCIILDATGFLASGGRRIAVPPVA